MDMLADDLFAGAGGWEVAAARLGIHARGVENMDAARRTRDAAGLETIHDDVWTFKPRYRALTDAEVYAQQRAKGASHRVALIVAGLIASPPCQTFSQAGQGAGRKALDDVLALLPHVGSMTLQELRDRGQALGDERTALVLTPLWFALHHPYRWLAWEQVPTVLPVWEACAEVLRECGWSVWAGVLNAEQYGVPQTRQRAVLLASTERDVHQPVPTHSQYHRHDPERLDAGVPPWVSVADALPHREDLPAWCRTRPSTTVVGSFRPEIVAAPGYRTDVSRQDAPDSITVTVAEAGVLQSFPADYPWQGGRKGGQGPAYLQVGNAIPPGLALAALEVASGRERLPVETAETERASA